MFFRRKQEPPKKLDQNLAVPSQSKTEKLISALSEYQSYFSGSLRQGPDPQVRSAKRILAEAKRIVGETGLGPALAPTLMEAVEHWPSWSKRDDFQDHISFPATDIFGSKEQGERNHEITQVYFSYLDRPYGVIIYDEGYSSGFSSDVYKSGKVELLADGAIVLGLDISQDVGSEYSRWRWSDLYAFQSGDWMKDLIEMAAYIEASQKRSFEQFFEDDAIKRARNIKI